MTPPGRGAAVTTAFWVLDRRRRVDGRWTDGHRPDSTRCSRRVWAGEHSRPTVRNYAAVPGCGTLFCVAAAGLAVLTVRARDRDRDRAGRR